MLYFDFYPDSGTRKLKHQAKESGLELLLSSNYSSDSGITILGIYRVVKLGLQQTEMGPVILHSGGTVARLQIEFDITEDRIINLVNIFFE